MASFVKKARQKKYLGTRKSRKQKIFFPVSAANKYTDHPSRLVKISNREVFYEKQERPFFTCYVFFRSSPGWPNLGLSTLLWILTNIAYAHNSYVRVLYKFFFCYAKIIELECKKTRSMRLLPGHFLF